MKKSSLCLIVWIFSACQTTPYSTLDAQVDAPLLTEDRRQYMLFELEQQRSLWAKITPQKYSYEISNFSFWLPAPAKGPNEIIVEDDVVIRRVYLGRTQDGYEAGVAVPDNLVLNDSIIGLFDTIERHLKPPSETWFGTDVKVNLTADYDPIRGFPEKITFDAEGVVDDQFTLTIKNFTVLK